MSRIDLGIPWQRARDRLLAAAPKPLRVVGLEVGVVGGVEALTMA